MCGAKAAIHGEMGGDLRVLSAAVCKSEIIVRCHFCKYFFHVTLKTQTKVLRPLRPMRPKVLLLLPFACASLLLIFSNKQKRKGKKKVILLSDLVLSNSCDQ